MGRLPKPLPFLSTPVLSLTGHALFARSNGESPVSSFFLRMDEATRGLQPSWSKRYVGGLHMI